MYAFFSACFLSFSLLALAQWDKDEATTCRAKKEEKEIPLPCSFHATRSVFFGGTPTMMPISLDKESGNAVRFHVLSRMRIGFCSIEKFGRLFLPSSSQQVYGCVLSKPMSEVAQWDIYVVCVVERNIMIV